MITSGYDPEACVLVSVAAGGGNSDAELERLVAGLERLAVDANRAKRQAIYVIAVASDSQRPDAGWRRRIAAAEQKCDRLRVALVTESAVIRGVLTAMEWLNPSRQMLSRSAHADLPEAIAALERDAGGPLPQILRLHAAAQAEITAGGGRPARVASR